MIGGVFDNIGYFLTLSLRTELLWIIFPLGLATIVMLIYSGKYQGERPGWNSYVSNSLVLLFVSVILLRQIYGINEMGAINFITYPWKFWLSVGLLLVGVLILFLNFRRYLPEKVALRLSSPITLNLFAYVVTLFVFSGLELSGVNGGVPTQLAVPYNDLPSVFLSLLLLFLFLMVFLNVILDLIGRAFTKLRRMKEKEIVENISAEKKKIREGKKLLKKEEIKLKKDTLRKISEEKRKVKRLKKAVVKR